MRDSGEKRPTIARIGVYNVFGANEPRFGPVPAPFTPVPASMRAIIKRVVTASRTGPTSFLYNDVSLQPQNVFPVLAAPAYAFSPNDYWLMIGKGVTVATYLIKPVALNAVELDGKLVVKVRDTSL